jgi:hypothetical protein
MRRQLRGAAVPDAGPAGLRPARSPRRDPNTHGYGTYLIVDLSINGIVGGPGIGLDDVARWANDGL